MGISNLPPNIRSVDDIDQIGSDAIVLIDESGISFNSRDSMSNSNKMLGNLLKVARHKSLTIIFVSQNSSNLDIDIIRQADFMILKPSSLFQKDFERPIINKLYDRYNDGFTKHIDKRGLSLIYTQAFTGFVDNDLPSFWSDAVSKSFSNFSTEKT
jgi:hypothetical protein